MEIPGVTDKVARLANRALDTLAGRFAEIDGVAAANTARVLDAFRDLRVSESCFAGTTGYGYGDLGRETLDRVYATVFGAEEALVRAGFVSGTHAIYCALSAAVKAGETLLCASGEPYDTLRTVIGIDGDGFGTLAAAGVGYRQLELTPNGEIDIDALSREVTGGKVGCVFIQRSGGYAARRALTVSEIREAAAATKKANGKVNIVVDNCYGEFTEETEPTHAGADLIAGSLIKNPGGGLAPCGGYVAGARDLVSRAAQRLTAPGTGGECGPTLGLNRLLFQGFFLAPHTVAQSLKTAVFCAELLTSLGFSTSPGAFDLRSDIIQTIELGTADRLKRFCRGIQAASPVDAFVSPEPWQMPGYSDEVIMSAGTFVQGASIELSADGPMREPYRAFLQGSLTFESGMLAVCRAVSEMLD